MIVSLLWWLLFCIILRIGLSEKNQLTAEELIASKKLWKSYAESSHDSNRSTNVKRVLSEASGIYLDKTKVHPRLEDTVLINVVEADSSDNGNYKQYLKNLLCFTKNHKYKTVLYLIDSNATSFAVEVEQLRRFDSNIQVLSYPYELFWNVVQGKETNMNTGFGKADYIGQVPTFKHFGAFVMLVPLLEALQLGHNVIFFDVDVALVRDPLPYMVLGKSDFIVSPEMRTCNFPSLVPNTDWNGLEPNTGTMHVRATKAGVTFFKGWLRRIVNDNTMNDQRVVNFEVEPNGTRSNDCDINTVKYGRLDPAAAAPEGFFRYCYLNEFVFQNGLMEFYCSKGKRGSSIGAYTLGMTHSSIGSVNDSTTTLSTSMTTKMLYAPATLHVNFCVTKKIGLDDRGLWLYQQQQQHHPVNTPHHHHHTEDTCTPYNIRKTTFGLTNWTERVSSAQQEMNTAMELMKEGDVVKYPRHGVVYLYRNASLHSFPNRETFLKMGYDFDKIVTLKNPVFWLLSYGADLPSLE